MLRTALSTSVLLAVLAGSLYGQTIRVQIADSAGHPIPAALVSILDGTDSPVRVLVSDSRGGIELYAADAAGMKLRIERPGYLAFTSELPALAGPEPRTVRVQAERRVLQDYRATSAECVAGTIPGFADELWREAALGLRVMALAEEARMLDVRGGRYVRVMDSTGRVQQGIVDHESFAGWTVPYPGPRLTRLPESGFAATDSTGTLAYLVPAPFLLLSPSFLETHCIDRIVVERGRRNEVGLGFRPTGENKVAGVAGVLWLARTTAEPRSIEWEYRDPTRTVPRGARGLIAFGVGRDSLPQTVRWWVQVPQVFESGAAGRVTNVVESGAFVLAANDRPVNDPEGVFAALGEVFSIDPIVVEGTRAQRTMTEEGTKHIEPDELLGAPPTHAWDIVRILRPNWVRRSESIGLSSASSAGGLSFVVYQDRMRLSCLASETADRNSPTARRPRSEGGCLSPQAALMSISAADIGSIEYVPPIEAGAIYGQGHGYGVVVIHTRRK